MRWLSDGSKACSMPKSCGTGTSRQVESSKSGRAKRGTGGCDEPLPATQSLIHSGWNSRARTGSSSRQKRQELRGMLDMRGTLIDTNRKCCQCGSVANANCQCCQFSIHGSLEIGFGNWQHFHIGTFHIFSRRVRTASLTVSSSLPENGVKGVARTFWISPISARAALTPLTMLL